MLPKTPILLTGGTGHTGRRLAANLLEKGARLRCLIHTPEHQSRLPQSDRIEIVYGSATNPDDLAAALQGVETLVHIAHIRYAPAIVPVLERLYTPQHPVRFLAMSSTRLLSRFPSPIREVVRNGEEAIQSASPAVQWTIARPSMIFGGPDDNNLERLAAYLKKTQFFPIFGSGENLVQPIFVRDLVTAMTACLETSEAIGKTYTLAGPQAFPYKEMVEAVAQASGAKPPLFVRLPLKPSLALAHWMQRMWPANPLNPEMIERFGEDRAFNISAACADLRYSPTPFSEALALKFRREV